MSSNESWSLSVKAIGSTLKECTSSSGNSRPHHAANTPPTSSSTNSRTGEDRDDDHRHHFDDHHNDKTTHDNAPRDDDACTAEKNFTVVVSPDDALTSLYDQIEDVTGLKASQQRLIYRGRIIPGSARDNNNKNNNNQENAEGSEQATATPEGEEDTDGGSLEASSPSGAAGSVPEQPTTTKIKDIVGLGDGHTIHLVKKQESPVSRTGSGSPSTSSTSNNSSRTTGRASSSNNNNNNNSDRDETLSGNGTASLLAALMGLSGLDEGGDPNTTGRSRWRSARGRTGGRSSTTTTGGSRPHYRLTADDLRVPDPGTLEPVRQNLMTLHTLLPHARHVGNTESPLEAQRQWYRGQWLDVRDTVNQWLEATVVEILTPDQVLPPRIRDDREDEKEKDEAPPPRRQILEPATDPAVGAGDLAGRRRLLLEPCDVGDDEDEGGELEGFRRRPNNAGVQLLLIHYNGWPHRWDEWIRSDSERIRPFRTRTRHPNMATYSSPTTQSPFNESPPTHIVDAEHAVERPAILPELTRAVGAIQELLTVVAAEESAQLTSEQQEHLPWATRARSASSSAHPTVSDFVDTKDEEEVDDEDSEDEDALPPILSAEEDESADDGVSNAVDTSSRPAPENNANGAQPQLRRRQLQMLAPLLDRLGRTLVDAAPHVAALANDSAENSSHNDTEESVVTTEAVVAPSSDDNSRHPSTLGGLLSLLNRDRRRQSSRDNIHDDGNDNNLSGDNEEPTATEVHQTWPVDPDYVDFATGAVNTTRGEVRSGPRSRSANDDIAGLLGAYLAAASLGLNTSSSGGSGGGTDDNDDTASNVMGLGRLLRERGNNGGGSGGSGIDIHIHAVVTAPGMPPTPIGGGGTGLGGIGAGLGLAALGGLPTAGATTVRSPSTPTSLRGASSSILRHRTPLSVEDEEEDSLFSDLYSESPDPVDPNNSPDPERGSRQERTSPSDSDFLARLTHASSRSASTSVLGTPRRSSASGSAERFNRQNSDASSSRRSSTSAASSRRGSMFGRLFRRRRSSRDA